MYPQPGMQPMQPNLGSSHYPPTFSYAPTVANAQHRGGAYMGSTLMSGGLGAAQGIVNMGSMGVMGAGAINAVSSFVGAPILASSAIGTAAGSGLLSGLVGGPVGLGLMAAGAGLSIANTGVQNANRVGNMFGNMQFANAAGDPTTGRGFSQRDLMTLQRGVRAIDANNPFVSMSDALRATERFTEMGMHQGVQDAEKLAKKVTQLGKTMHQMARSLGTSMEEAGQIFKDMRGSGFYSAQDVMGNTANMTLMRGFGMSSQQFAQMQRTGAGMTRGAQMSGRAGAGMITAKTAEFMNAIRTGQMSAEEMMDMTGASSPLEAAQLMAQQTLAGTMGGLSGALGTGMLLAAGATDKSGRFTGEVDAGILRRMSQGSLSRNELMDIGGGKRNSRIGQASFMARRQDIMESMLESDQGQEALFGMVRSITEEMFGEGAGEDQDLFQLVAETQFNMDRRAVRKLQELKDGRGQRLAALKREIATNQRAAEIRENRTLAGVTQRISGSVSDVMEDMAMPFSEYYRDFTGGLQQMERTLLGGGSDVKIGTTRGAIDDAMIETFTGGREVNLAQMGIGEAARRGVIDQALPELNQKAFSRSSKSNLSSAFLGEVRTEEGLKAIARQTGIMRTTRSIRDGATTEHFDRNTALQAARMAREAATDPDERREIDRRLTELFGEDIDGLQDVSSTRQDQEKLVEALGGRRFTDINQGSGSQLGTGLIAALAVGGVLAAIPTGGASLSVTAGALIAGGIYAIDTDEEEALARLIQGGPAAAVLEKYQSEDEQKRIDNIIATNTPEDAAKLLSKKYGIKLTARDVQDINTMMTDRTGKTAIERKHEGVDEKIRKSVGNAAGNLVKKEAQKRVDQQLSLLSATSTRVSGLERGEDELVADFLGRSIAELSEKGFVAKTEDDIESRILGHGVSVFQDLNKATAGGLSLEEMTKATGLNEETVLKLIEQQEGVKMAGGRAQGDVKGLVRSLAGVAAGGVGISEQKETFLNAGMSATERQSLSVYRAGQMIDSIYQAMKDEGIKVNSPGDSNAASVAGE